MIRVTALILCVLPVVALSHSGVKDPQVMARMESMKSIGEATKVLGQMAKGERAFDAQAAESAAAAIARDAARTPALFEPRADDPKSEALPVIWERWEDFVEKSQALEAAATQAKSLPDIDALRAALGQIGQTCKACHEVYRQP